MINYVLACVMFRVHGNWQQRMFYLLTAAFSCVRAQTTRNKEEERAKNYKIITLSNLYKGMLISSRGMKMYHYLTTNHFVFCFT